MKVGLVCPERRRAMKVIFDALIVSAGMMVIFFCAFLAVFLLALLLVPIENKLSSLMWKHSNHEEQKVVTKQTFRQFSQRHR
jgi:hypothetical protein